MELYALSTLDMLCPHDVIFSQFSGDVRNMFAPLSSLLQSKTDHPVLLTLRQLVGSSIWHSLMKQITPDADRASGFSGLFGHALLRSLLFAAQSETC